MNTQDSRSIHDLPVELIQLIAFRSGLSPLDVLSFVLASKTMYGMVLGCENEYDRDQHRALAGVGACCREAWWRAACLAVERGIGDPTEEWEDVKVVHIQSEYGEGVRIKTTTQAQNTPLSWAAEHGRLDLVSALLSRPNLYSPSTPFFEQLEYAVQLAIDMGHWNIVEVLLQTKAGGGG